MRKTFLIIISTAIIATFLFYSCIGEKRQAADFITINIDVNDGLNKIKFSEIVDSVSFIPLETNMDYLIGQIDKVLTTKDYIFILDSRSAEALYMFDRKGKFIRKIGQKGAGPQEYQKPLDFILTDGKIILLDISNSLLTYDLNGRFVERSRFENFSALKLIKTTNNNFAFISGGQDDNLILANPELGREASYFPYKNSYTNKLINRPFYNFENLTVYRRPYDDMLYEVQLNEEPRPYKLVDYSGKNFSIFNDEGVDYSESDSFFDYCITKAFYENKRFNLVLFMHQNEPWIYVESKIGNRPNKLFKHKNLVNDITFDNHSTYPIGVDGDSFIYYVEPNYILDAIANEDIPKNNFSSQIKSIGNNLKETSNPLLMLVNFDINEN